MDFTILVLIVSGFLGIVISYIYFRFNIKEVHHVTHQEQLSTEICNTNAKSQLSLPSSIFDAISIQHPNHKILLLPIHHSTIRPTDTDFSKSITSCCYSSACAKLNLTTMMMKKTTTSASPKVKKSDPLPANVTNKMKIASSLTLMRHFERLDHIEQNWFNQYSSTSSNLNYSSYFPTDPPLSRGGIADGINFAQQLANRLAKKNRSVEDNFTFIVSSPALRCLQTSLLVAITLRVPILIEESVSDWINRRVFGATINKKPRTSLCFQEGTSDNCDLSSDDSSSSLWWISEKILKDLFRNYFALFGGDKNKTCDTDDNNNNSWFLQLLPPGTVYDAKRKLFGFFDFSAQMRSSCARSNSNYKNRTFFNTIPEPEREFSERIKYSIENILTQSLRCKNKNIQSSPTSASALSHQQKSFTASQVAKYFCEHGNGSVTNRTENNICDYSLRLLVVTHADVVRVAATMLTPRCSCLPSAKDGVSVMYGSLTQMVKIVGNNGDDYDDDEETSNGANESSLFYYHLVCFGSRNPAALDCPIVKN